MPSLLRKSLQGRPKHKTKKKNDVSNKNAREKEDNRERFVCRLSQHSSFALDGKDMVIVAAKKSKKRISGLELEKQGHYLVVRRILEGSLFEKTDLAPEMEIRIINGIDCSKLEDENEAYKIMREAECVVTIVAREKVEGRDNPLQPILQPILQPPSSPPPKQWSTDTKRIMSPGTAHMWLKMVEHVHRRDDAPRHLSPSPKSEEFYLRKEEQQASGEDIHAPPAPAFKKTCRPKALPDNLEVKNETSHSTMSEITLNPSQHPTPNSADIVVMRPSEETKTSSIKTVLASLYPDFGGDDDETEDIVSCIEQLSTESYSSQDISLVLSSLLRDNEEPPSHVLGIDVSHHLIDDDGSFRRGAGPMDSPSLYAPSIPRVGA